MLLTDPGSDSFKSISSAFQDPLRQSAEPWCFSLMLSAPHRVGVGQGRSEGAAGASTIQIFMFTASRHKTKQNTTGNTMHRHHTLQGDVCCSAPACLGVTAGTISTTHHIRCSHTLVRDTSIRNENCHMWLENLDL